ncbi:MAG: ROK family protein [Phaeodactylibacter sp.]|nr:ROK family protein [Phaeodactylibacter sp.]
MSNKKILGIDVGASGIKGAIVDLEKGDFITERIRLETPNPATPHAMARTFAQVVKALSWKGDVIGCGFPAIIKNGIAQSAANIEETWVDTNVETIFSKACGKTVKVINDADAAGIASMTYGDGRNQKGTVLFITIGSGLGSAVFTDGQLVPNTELGHLFIDDELAETYASGRARKRLNLSWDEWGYRFNKYLRHLERLFSPDLILLGGGGSKRFDQFQDQLRLRTPVRPEGMQNKAGIVGAAYYGAQFLK